MHVWLCSPLPQPPTAPSPQPRRPHSCGKGAGDGRCRREQSQQGECAALLTAAGVHTWPCIKPCLPCCLSPSIVTCELLPACVLLQALRKGLGDAGWCGMLQPPVLNFCGTSGVPIQRDPDPPFSYKPS